MRFSMKNVFEQVQNKPANIGSWVIKIAPWILKMYSQILIFYAKTPAGKY